MKLSLGILLVSALLSVSCVSATADVESICSSRSVSFMGSATKSALGERTIQDSTDEDISDTLRKVADSTDSMSLSSVSMTLDGDVAFINHLKVVLHSDKLGDLILSDSSFLAFDGNVPMTADRGQLLSFLENGKVTMTVYATGNVPVRLMDINSNLCVGVEASAKKSL